MSSDVSKRVKEALDRTEIMALSTVGDDGSWVSPVRFEYNERLELTFTSMMDTKHVQNILKDPRVSAAIYSFPGPPGGNLGLQIKGKAEHISSGREEGWQQFKITPDEVWYFDSRELRKRQKVDLSKLQIDKK
jgi:general stress protein 26